MGFGLGFRVGVWVFMGFGCLWGLGVYGVWVFMGFGCLWGLGVYGVGVLGIIGLWV